jgi:hypothetical protein
MKKWGAGDVKERKSGRRKNKDKTNPSSRSIR